jgi:CRP-like cAMP-binding protein
MGDMELTWRNQNKLLALLPESNFRHVAPLLSLCKIEQKRVLLNQGEQIRHVYFPCSNVYSTVIAMADGNTVEVSTIGNEGITSLSALLDDHVANTTLICQISGMSLRMNIDDFKWEAEHNPHFRTVVNLYGQAYLAQVQQSVACNKLHNLEQRAARWLLMTHDRTRQDEFPLTQELLAIMLGAHRPTISLLARKFEQAGALTYTRGMMRILRRGMLEDISCECYAASRQQFERLLGAGVG